MTGIGGAAMTSSNPQEPLRAAIYCRISLDKKIGTDAEGEGVNRQEQACRQMCEINGYQIVEVYQDNSVSAHGTELRAGKEREAYNRMIADYHDRKFDVIVAWKLDRLTRSVAGLEDMIKEVASQGLSICTTDLGGVAMSLNEATSVMIAQIAALFLPEFSAMAKNKATPKDSVTSKNLVEEP